jgi:uncharacterized glyoxalase superfamily protein PhnB
MAIHDCYVYLRARDARAAIGFYQRAFDASEKFRLVEPGGRIGHVELLFGDTTVMVSDEFPEIGCRGPAAGADSTFAVHLHVDDADAVIAQAVAAGATLLRAAADHFYGERSGTIRDPFGYDWMIGHSIEAVEPAEMQRRYDALFASAGP